MGVLLLSSIGSSFIILAWFVALSGQVSLQVLRLEDLLVLLQGDTVGGIVAYEFERKMWKRIQETVKKVSQVQPTLESVDTYHH